MALYLTLYIYMMHFFLVIKTQFYDIWRLNYILYIPSILIYIMILNVLDVNSILSCIGFYWYQTSTL